MRKGAERLRQEEDDAIAEELKKKMNLGGDGDAKTPGSDENAKGVPEFWLHIFRQVDTLSEMLQEHDEPIVRHLEDIKVKYSDPGKPMSFELEFLFSENDYFTNKSLSKVYMMRAEPDEADPLSFEGPEIIKCTGCKIDWKKGKDVTVKVIKKRQKHKSKGSVRTIEKKVKGQRCDREGDQEASEAQEQRLRQNNREKKSRQILSSTSSTLQSFPRPKMVLKKWMKKRRRFWRLISK